jgi:hypothetical protein
MKPDAVLEKRKDKIPYDYYKIEFAKKTPQEIQENTGLPFDEELGVFHVKLLTDVYQVSHPDGEVTGPQPNIKYSWKTLLLRYLINARGIKPSGHMIHYRDVPDGNIYYSNFYGRCLLRLGKTFKKNPHQLSLGLEALGGTAIGKADISYEVPFINNIILYVLYWHGDDEFPPSTQILFSDNVSYYFSAEDLAFVGDILNDYLLKFLLNQG